MAGSKNSGRRSVREESATAEAHILYQRSRAKEKAHKANIAELEEKRKRKELIDARQVAIEADAAARLVRNAMLAIPDRVAPLLVGRSEAEILSELRKEIRLTLGSLGDEISAR